MTIRQRAMAAGLANGPAALGASIAPEEFFQAEQICGLTTVNANALRRAESGYILQILAERWLSDNSHISSKQLDDAWVTMNGAAKARIEQWVVKLDHEPETEEVAYRAFVSALGHASDLRNDSRPKLLTYIQGRAFRAVYEPKF